MNCNKTLIFVLKSGYHKDRHQLIMRMLYKTYLEYLKQFLQILININFCSLPKLININNNKKVVCNNVGCFTIININ